MREELSNKTQELVLGLSRKYGITFDDIMAISSKLSERHIELSESYWREKIAIGIEGEHYPTIRDNQIDTRCHMETCTHISDAKIARGIAI